MNPSISLWMAALVACGASVAFAWGVRLPLPFDGFAALAAAGLAALGTVTVLAWMPQTWVWTDAERLRHAFQARHNMSAQAAQTALDGITQAQSRADALRRAAIAMRADMTEKLENVADRLDNAALEIFYDPARQRNLRTVLIRSELIEDAARAHAKLRSRDQAATEQASREKLMVAVDALDAAFDQTDLSAARGLLAQVETASEVAETLLRPKRRAQDKT